MFLLPRRQIWTQQPQALTGIDRSDSITRDLCFVQSGGLADIFTNVGTTQKPTTRGVVRSFDAALSQYLFANNKQVVGPALTLFALFSVNNLTSNLALISVGGPASSRHILYVAPDGIAAMFSGEGVPYGQAQSATGMLSDKAQYYFSVGRVSANNSRDIWVNGKQIVSDSTSVAVSPANIDRVAIGAYWNNGAPVAGIYFDGSIALSGAYSRALSDDEIVALSANPWRIFKRPDSRIFVPVSAGGGSVNANASGALSAVAVTAPSASASGGASASGALATITIYSPTATASAGCSASASGSFAALSISPATATATATKSATASGAFATISLSAPTATASGTSAGNAIASGAPAQITISHATAIAIGSAVASGGFQSIGITAPSATASVGDGNATASGAWAAVSITAPTGYASSGFIRAPSGSGPTVIQPGSIRPRQSATNRPTSNTGGRRY